MLPGQTRVAREGEFEVRIDGRLAGREAFVVHETGDPGGRPTRRVNVSAWYPADERAATLRIVVELDADTLLRTVQIEEGGARPRRYFVSFGPRRITLRIVSATGEAAREYPSAPRHLLMDDSALALLTIPRSGGPGPVAVFHPRAGRRGTATLEPLGDRRTVFRGAERDLDHLLLRLADGVVHLWRDEAGDLLKIEIPARNLVAERVDRPRR